MSDNLVADDSDRIGSDAYTEQVLREAELKQKTGPKILFPGMHGRLIVPPQRQDPAELPEPEAVRLPLPLARQTSLGQLVETGTEVDVQTSPNIPLPEQRVPTFLVTLIHQNDRAETVFDLCLESTDIFVDEEQISLALASTTQFKPRPGMRFLLKFGNQQFHVAFMGSAFRFPRLNLNGLSFIRITN